MAKENMDPMQMVAAWRQVGLACGFYEPEVKVAKPSAAGQGAKTRLELMSNAELMNLVAAGAAINETA